MVYASCRLVPRLNSIVMQQSRSVTSEQPECPDCNSQLEVWDSISPGTLKYTGIGIVMGEPFAWVALIVCGAAFFVNLVVGLIVVTLLVVWFIRKVRSDTERTTIYRCSNCRAKFTGLYLKPFEWSDYEGS